MLPTTLSEIDLAYAAGFYDGEGTCAAYAAMCKQACIVRGAPHKEGRIHQKVFAVSISNTYEPVLLWFERLFGGSVHSRGSARSPLTRKTDQEWKASGPTAYAFFKAILPYLQEKQDRAELMLSIWEQRSDTALFLKLCDERRQRWGRGGTG